MPITLVNSPSSPVPGSKNPTEDRLASIKGEITSMLEEKIEELRRESERVKSTMEQALYRIGQQGFETKLDDLRSGRWHKVSTEVKILQDVMDIIQAAR
jgi:hypothetical protein